MDGKFKANRVILETNVIYENVTVWNWMGLEEQGIDLLYGSDTVALKEETANVIYTVHAQLISSVIIHNPAIKIRPEHYYTFDRITMFGGASYTNGILVPPEYQEIYGIPVANPPHVRQMAIFADDMLIITTETDISSIKNLSSTTQLKKKCPKPAGNK